MKRTIPLLLTAISGLLLIVAFFIPAWQGIGEEIAIWFDILASIAFVLGGGNLLRLQLKRVSERKPGWGYSILTLTFFLVTLVVGLLKYGCPPEPSVELFGESLVPYPLSALPEYRVAGEISGRADGAPLPASTRRQLSESDGELVFRGWLQPSQKKDLLAYDDTLAWRCAVEQLAERARPPEALRQKLRYEPDHRALVFTGYMSDEEQLALNAIFSASPDQQEALAELSRLARRATTRKVPDPPESFAIPKAAEDYVSLEENRLTVRGPMTPQLRDDLAIHWRNDPYVRPFTVSQQNQLLAEIEERGPELTERQRAVFQKAFAGDWRPELLIQTLNTAGVNDASPRAYCEIQAEIAAGNPTPEPLSTPEPDTKLNAEQAALIEQFVATPEMTQQQLRNALEQSGTFTARQQASFEYFFDALPSVAEKRRELFFQLAEQGPLSREQREFLLSPGRERFRWRQAIGELYIAAHQVKYPWSGSYNATGSIFWWLYEYVLQPLMTTTFAMLAFYVASAAFRAFRAKNLEAVLLLGTAFIVLLGRTSAGPFLTSWVPDSLSALKIDQMTVYIMSIFNTAGNRAIMIGIALGIVSTSLKVLLGIDRSYLGSGND